MRRARPKRAAHAWLSINRGSNRAKKLPGTYFSSRDELQMRACIASTFRLVCNSKHNFSARVMRRGLLLCRDCFAERQNLRDDWLDLSGVDQLRDLCEIFCIRMNGDTSAANPAFLELDPIWKGDQRHDNATFLHHVVRTGERFFADRIEHGVHIFYNIFKPGLCMIHCDVCAELLESILICRRSGRDDAGTTCFGDLHREAANPA